MSVEAPRKHGPFDTRWPPDRRDGSDGVPSAQPLLAADVAEGLDWYAFSARYFRRRGRHNLEAASGYAAYRHGREWRNGGPPKTRRLRLVPPQRVPPVIEAEWEIARAQRLLAAVAAVHVWEGEGGYTPGWDEG
jgi:hypothetical protein